MKDSKNIFDFDDLFETSGEPNDGCSMFPAVLALAMLPKPFGLIWEDENVKYFLGQRGYKFVKRYSEEKGSNYEIAVKADAKVLPEVDNDSDYGVIEVFNREVQKVIVELLLRFSNGNK